MNKSNHTNNKNNVLLINNYLHEQWNEIICVLNTRPFMFVNETIADETGLYNDSVPHLA